MTGAPRGQQVPILHGMVDGIPHSIPLRHGRNRIGSLPSSDVVLDTPGVSRRHAVLNLTPEGLSVEDLASKNGTFVNGRRLEFSRVELGDEIAFGPAVLVLGSADPADLELGIRLPNRDSTDVTLIERDTTTRWPSPTHAVAEHWLAVTEAFVAYFVSATGSDLAVALRQLVERLGAAGACWLEQRPDQAPIVLAGHGLFDAGHLETALASPLGADEIRVFETRTPEPGKLTIASTGFRPSAGAAEVASHLAIWASPQSNAAWDPLLRTILRLAHRIPGGEKASSRSVSVGSETDDEAGLDFPPGYVVGGCPATRALHRQLAAAAPSSLPVLILGETGAGKEEIARILHRSNPRRRGAFIAINCAALPADLLEAELFGIGDRVATGVAARRGKLQLAEGGTLFLDEIGEMAPALQSKLLRALETTEIHPVGSGSPIRIDVRILAATNARLEAKIQAGTFRSDLYYRLAGFVITVPDLGERRQDIPILAEHFLRRATAESGKSIPGMTVAALGELVRKPWPGNVRELRHAIQRLVHLCPPHRPIDLAMVQAGTSHGAVLGVEKADADDVRLDEDETVQPSTSSKPPVPPAPPTPPAPTASSGDSGDESATIDLGENLLLADIEKRVIQEALERTDGNKTRAAELLGISREALRRRLKR